MEKSSPKHQLAVFAKAAEALSYAGRSKVDLFILDIQLLDYRGTALAKQLRALPEYRFTPILFTTELAGEELAAYREIKCYDLEALCTHIYAISEGELEVLSGEEMKRLFRG